MNEPFVAIKEETIQRLIRAVVRERDAVDALRKETSVHVHSIVTSALNDEVYALALLLSDLNGALHKAAIPLVSHRGEPALRKSEESFEEKGVDF